jgi:hypothetical protein
MVDPVEIDFQNSSTGHVLSFSVPPSAKPIPAILKLQFVMSAQAADPSIIAQMPTLVSKPGVSEGPIGPVVGPFQFSFSVNTVSTTVVSINQVIEAAGVRMTLRKVSVRPSETQIELCYDGSDPAFQNWTPIFQLDAGVSPDLFNTGNGAGLIPNTACNMLHFNIPLSDQKGTWKLTVSEIVGFVSDGSNQQERRTGPWVFRFEMTMPSQK